MDNDDYIINMLALQLAKELKDYNENYQDVDGSACELENAVKKYCKRRHLSNE